MRYLKTHESWEHSKNDAELFFKDFIKYLKLNNYKNKYDILNIIKNDEKFGPLFYINVDDGVKIFNIMVYKNTKDVRVKLISGNVGFDMYYTYAYEFNSLIRSDKFIDLIIDDKKLWEQYIDVIGFDNYTGTKYEHYKTSTELGLL